MGRRALAALALLLVVVGAAWLLGRRSDRAAREVRREARLLQFDDRRVTAFTVVLRDRRSRFERGPSGWRMVEPVQDAASIVAIERLLATARRAPVVDVVDEPESLASYGLDPPRASVSLEGVDVPPLDIGDRDPTGRGVFARVGGRPGVLLLSLPEAIALDVLDPDGLRDETAVGLGRGEIRAVTIERSRAVVEVRREPSGWWIAKPRRLPASDAAVDRLLSAVEKVAIVHVDDTADKQDPRFGLARPDALRVTVATDGDGPRRTLTFGADAPDGTRFAGRDDRAPVLAVDDGSLRDAPLDLAALVDVRLTKHNRYGVVRMVWTDRTGQVTTERASDDRWTTGTGGAIDGQAVLAFLVGTIEAPVSGWRDSAKRGEPVARLELVFEGNASDAIDFLPGGEARVDSLPGVVFRLRAPVPAFPATS